MDRKKEVGIVAGLILLDQVTKIALKGVNSGIINYTVNYGAAFSVLQGYRWLFVVAALVVIIAAMFYYKQVDHKIAILLVISGSIGNLIDRAIFGYVRDFVDLKFWPVFNVADSLSVIGVMLLVYYEFIKKK